MDVFFSSHFSHCVVLRFSTRSYVSHLNGGMDTGALLITATVPIDFGHHYQHTAMIPPCALNCLQDLSGAGVRTGVGFSFISSGTIWACPALAGKLGKAGVHRSVPDGSARCAFGLSYILFFSLSLRGRPFGPRAAAEFTSFYWASQTWYGAIVLDEHG